MHRNIFSQSGTPIQQSITVNPEDYTLNKVSGLMLGVVVAVRYCDSDGNKSAQQFTDRRGFRTEVDVLVTQDGRGSNLTLRNVLVSHSMPSGLHNFVEFIPREATKLVSGEDLPSDFTGIDPYDLDGDWCVIGFVGQSMIHPVVVSWVPHFRNLFDPQTSTVNSTLDQKGRYYSRVNGVETIITPSGDIVLSTALSGGKVKYPLQVDKGRPKADVPEDEGGSILVQIKESQTLELGFDPPREGEGPAGRPMSSLPQTNPPPSKSGESTSKEKAYVKATSESIFISLPDLFSLKTKGRISIDTEDKCLIHASSDIKVESDTQATLEAETVKLGDSAVEPAVKGQSLQSWIAGCTVDSPFGPLPVNAAYAQTLVNVACSTKVKVE